MKIVKHVVLTSAGLMALSNTASGQPAGEERAGAEMRLEEIIVTARRKDERLQDVPSTVNVVTGENIEKLNIRSFQDIQSVVPGLNLYGTNATNTTASVRGITFNQVTSGNNGVLEFYLNDSPMPASTLFQVMYDIGQIELLRGPQGTLRGRAAPAGSMTINTRRPELNDWGGYANATGTDEGEYNFNGAVNIPLIDEMLSLRIAALYDENDANAVNSVNNGIDPEATTKSGRATVRFEPTDKLSFVLTYQMLDNERISYTQMESLRAVDPSAPASPVFITAADRSSVQDTPFDSSTTVDTLNLQAQWAFLGQRLNYVGSKNHAIFHARDVLDIANVFGPSDPAFAQGYSTPTRTNVRVESHELRLSSEVQLFGMLDYAIGAFSEELESPTNYNSATTLFIPPPRLLLTSIARLNETDEKSIFGNLTLHLGEKTEISAGARRLEYTADAGLLQNGVPVAAIEQHDDFSATIYTGSVKYRFNEDLMVYGSVGTSWRPGVTVVGDFNLTPSPQEVAFTQLAPEESTSYEIGVKASALDQRLRMNLALFHQEYDNNPWRSPSSIYFINTAAPPAGQSVLPFNFAGAVPVTIDGAEAEVFFVANDYWDMNVNASYAKGEIDDGLVPCNDYLPHDGVPDTGSAIPTIPQIRAAAGSENLTACTVSYRSSQSPEFSASLQSEFHMPVTSSLDGYVRGLVSYYGDSQNDPTNPVDDIDSYALLNLYLGIRSAEGAWDVSLYGKNIADSERVLSRSQTPLSTSYRAANGAAITGASTYRTITMTEPREFGLSLRYSFGSR